MNEKHHHLWQLLQNQCCCFKFTWRFDHLSEPAPPFHHPHQLDGWLPKPHTSTHLLFSFQNPPSYQLASPDSIHPSIILSTSGNPILHPICQFGFRNPIPHNYCSASHNPSIFPISILPLIYWLTSPTPTFSPTLQLGSKAHPSSYSSVPLELLEKFCILPLIFYEEWVGNKKKSAKYKW